MTILRNSLMTLEAYAKERKAMRERVIQHKKNRAARLGNHVALLFEDELTIRYQIQEMLHIEKIFDEEGIQAELDTYLPLVPDGKNLKATMQIEYENEIERHAALRRLIGIEDRVFLQVDGEPPVYAIADEDLERDNEEKTSAVHFLRFEFTETMRARVRESLRLYVGCDHPGYFSGLQQIEPRVVASLIGDFE
jgi:hypothetical protein